MEDCFECGWYNPNHIGMDLPKCNKLRKSTDPYNPICNKENEK